MLSIFYNNVYFIKTNSLNVSRLYKFFTKNPQLKITEFLKMTHFGRFVSLQNLLLDL